MYSVLLTNHSTSQQLMCVYVYVSATRTENKIIAELTILDVTLQRVATLQSSVHIDFPRQVELCLRIPQYYQYQYKYIISHRYVYIICIVSMTATFFTES